MSVAEAIKQSDWRMSEGASIEFAERVLFDGEEIIAGFQLHERHSLVFTNKRVLMEDEGNEWTSPFSESAPRKRLTSIPYKNISMHAVVLDTRQGHDASRGILKLWIPGYYNDLGHSFRWLAIDGAGKLDLNLLSKILSEQIAKT